MKTAIEIRSAVRSDIPQVMALIRELAEYEKAPEEVTLTQEQLLEDGFGKNPVYELIVAEEDHRIIGIALFFIRYSTWKGRMLFLEDLVVNESHRGQGIGHALFKEILSIAHERQYAGVCWQVLDWNELALQFYARYKADISTEWLNGKIMLAQLNEMKWD